VEKSLEQLLVLKDVDLKIGQGSFTCIVGDVGAGKSSFINALIGDLMYLDLNLKSQLEGKEGVLSNEDKIKL